MRRGPDCVLDGDRQPRLANAGLTRRSAPRCPRRPGVPPAPQQQIEFFLATDQVGSNGPARRRTGWQRCALAQTRARRCLSPRRRRSRRSRRSAGASPATPRPRPPLPRPQARGKGRGLARQMCSTPPAEIAWSPTTTRPVAMPIRNAGRPPRMGEAARQPHGPPPGRRERPARHRLHAPRDSRNRPGCRRQRGVREKPPKCSTVVFTTAWQPAINCEEILRIEPRRERRGSICAGQHGELAPADGRGACLGPFSPSATARDLPLHRRRSESLCEAWCGSDAAPARCRRWPCAPP